MKEQYIAPQLQVVCFTPQEHLAAISSNPWDLNKLMDLYGAAGIPTSKTDDDLFFPIG